MSELNPERKFQTQKNIVRDTSVSGDFIFAPQQIETQIVEISAQKVTQQPLIKTSPYKGLKRFNQSDRQYFFGRDALIAKLLNAVNKSSFSLILGASGSGKSSTVRAGLIPELKNYFESKSPQKFYDFIFTPNQDPFESLYLCLLNEEKNYHFGKSDVEFVREGRSNTLSQLISRFKKDEERWLLFIDQFEQLFTDTDLENRKNLIEGIVQVAKKGDSSVRMVLAMRSDFLEQFSFYPTLGAIANQNNIHLVTEMYSDELRQAIEQPAAKHGVVFEPGLVEQIVKEVEGQSGYLPLLQYTLDLLWQKECTTKASDGRLHIEDRTLNKINYAALEGVRGALQKRVDQIYKNICAKNQQGELITKQIFLKLVNIVESDSGSRAVSRRGYRSEFIGDLVENILQRFIDENLLVSDYEYSSKEKLAVKNNPQPTQNATIEIAHEILLSSWEQLKRWIEEEKEAIILKNWLAGETRRWLEVRAENESKASDELLKGSRLEQILEFREKNAFEKLGGLVQEENELINASAEWRDREIKLAKHRQRQLIRNLTFGLITVSMLAGAAIWQLRRATVNEINALSNSAEALSSSNQQLDALVTGLKAGRKIQNSIFGVDQKTEIKLLGRLQNIFYQIREFNRLEGHKEDIDEVAFSPDGQIIASITVYFGDDNDDDKTIKLWNLKGKLLRTLEADIDFKNVVFSPNGQMIAAITENSAIKLWNLKGELLQTLEANTDDVSEVIFSPDSKNIISVGGYEGKTKLWNLKGELISSLGYPNNVVFSPNGQILASANEDSTIKLWNLKGKLLHTLKGYTDSVSQVMFSPNGQTITSIGRDNTIKSWNLEGKLLRSFNANINANTNNLVFSPDNQTMISYDERDSNVRVWNLEGKLLYTLENFTGGVDKVIFSPDGQTIAVFSGNSLVELCNLKGELLHSLFLDGYAGRNWDIVFSPNGQTVASIGNGSSVKLWNLKKELLYSLNARRGGVSIVKFSSNGQNIASVHDDGTTKLWNLKEKLLHSFKGYDNPVFSPDGKTLAFTHWDDTAKLFNLKGELLNSLNKVNSLVFSPNGQTLVSTNDDKSIKQWSLKGELLDSLDGHTDNVNSVVFSPDGQTIASASNDKTIKLWNLKGKLLQTFKVDTRKGIYRLVFSPDGKIIAAISGASEFSLWNLKGELLQTFKGGLNSVVFSPDGKTIAATSGDTTLSLWNLKGELLQSFSGHTDDIISIAFSSDGKTIISASWDRTVKLWSIDGELIVSLNGHKDWVQDLALSPDGKMIASASNDETIKLWSLDLDNVLKRGCNWAQDYLANNPNVSEQDRKLCQSQK